MRTLVNKKYINLGNRMSDSLAIKFVQACGTGRIEEVNSIFSSLSFEEKIEIIKFDHYACFHIAASNGHVDVISFIFHYIKSVTDEGLADEAVIPVFLARNGEGFKIALANKHIKAVEIILVEEYLFQFCMDIIEEAPNFIKILWNSALRNTIVYLFAVCCSQNISFVKRILEIVPQPSHHLLFEDIPEKLYITDKFCIMNINPFDMACLYGKLDIIQLLWNLSSIYFQKKIIEYQFGSCFILAAKYGHVEILKQLATWAGSHQLKTSILTSMDYSAFIYAADEGYLEVMQFIWESIPPSLQLEALEASNFAAFRLASRNQHFPVMNFLEAKIDAEDIGKKKKAVNQGVIPPKSIL